MPECKYMINFLKTKKTVLLFFIILTILFLVLLFSIANQKSKNITGKNSSSNVTEESQLEVAGFNPDPSETLIPSTNQTIYVTFNALINENSVRIDLTKKDIRKDESPQSINSQNNINSNTLEIIILEPILPLMEYSLRIFDLKNNLISKATYISEDIKPTPVEKNNIELSNFLPYETESFRLSYNEEKNIYIFNFKYNEKSDDSLLDQYEKAKKQAIEYIESNNIDSNSIVIEWRYS